MASTKLNLKDLTMRELLEYERASHIICAKYENLNKMESYQDIALNEKFQEMKKKYDSVIDEIERRVEEIK